MSSVSVENWCVTNRNLNEMLQNNNLSEERCRFLPRIVFGVGIDVTTAIILDGDVLDVETDDVTGRIFSQGLVMHIDGLDLGDDNNGRKCFEPFTTFSRPRNRNSPQLNFDSFDHHYTQGYYLADGVYPSYASLVETFSHPRNEMVSVRS